MFLISYILRAVPKLAAYASTKERGREGEPGSGRSNRAPTSNGTEREREKIGRWVERTGERGAERREGREEGRKREREEGRKKENTLQNFFPFAYNSGFHDPNLGCP